MAPAQASSKRIKTLSISRPVIYGNSARHLKDGDRKPDTPPEHTHKWSVFVRSPLGEGKAGDEDLSLYIKKVVFKLHDTYPNSTRSIEVPPFEVEETGWGEFEIGIKIFFHNDANEKNISLYHHLRLHPYKEEDKDKDVIKSLQYDEIVFNEPTELLFERLTSKPGNIIPEKTGEFNKTLERQELQRINNGLYTINKQIDELRKKIVEKSQGSIANTITR
ncbi:hypothetical protein WICMUC_001732 [Wickerhamomyces mucosus]|uniref:Protein AF-9 homolog n=1 Tax=Wickerhamomyces mucosus TaxID=1378264 RepID=A0A9P8TG80_9ASCO|nr:hypothetical protein WICMUC_001732 [Wickerhamomyces mucosus]